MVASDNIAIFFEGPNKEKDFAIDNLTIVPVIEQCDNLIWNYDFDIGDHRYWTYTGDDTGLVMINNAKYGEVGYSLSTVDRTRYWHGLAQEFKSTRCMYVGQILEVNVIYRLEDENGLPSSCQTELIYSGQDETCPLFGIKIHHTNGQETRINVGNAIGPYNFNEWNTLNGFFEVTQEMMDARYLTVFINRASAGTNIVVNSMDMFNATNTTYGIDTCPTNLVRNGDAELENTRSWYIKGSSNFGDITFVPGANNSTNAFHHSGRTAHYHGLWQYLDQDCMDVGSEWTVSADFQLFDDNGIATTCDPTTRFSTENALACPMFMFQSFTEGADLHQTAPLLNTYNNPWATDDWNPYEASFTMTTEHKAKDSTWFFIHNVPSGYSYSIDNIEVVPAASIDIGLDNCDNFLLTPDFEDGNFRYWKWIGQGLTLRNIDNSLYNETGYSLSTTERHNFFDGIAQNILKRNCMSLGMNVEVTMQYRLEDDDGAALTCDPLMKFTGRSESCPLFGIEINGSNGSLNNVKFGSTFGPYKNAQWNTLTGYFEVTQSMLNADSIELYINGSPALIDIVIDNVVMKEADANTFGIESCPTNLVLNGDAETGDARGWYIKGSSDFGEITLVPGNNSTYAFHHSGRTEHYHALWQYLDQDCMDVGSEWTIAADFQFFDGNGTSVGCDPTIRNDILLLNKTACPMIMFQSFTEGGNLYQTDAPLNNIPTPWLPNQWNAYEGTFTMTNRHKSKESTWFFVQNVPTDYTYSIDNVRFTRNP